MVGEGGALGMGLESKSTSLPHTADAKKGYGTSAVPSSRMARCGLTRADGLLRQDGTDSKTAWQALPIAILPSLAVALQGCSTITPGPPCGSHDTTGTERLTTPPTIKHTTTQYQLDVPVPPPAYLHPRMQPGVAPHTGTEQRAARTRPRPWPWPRPGSGTGG